MGARLLNEIQATIAMPILQGLKMISGASWLNRGPLKERKTSRLLIRPVFAQIFFQLTRIHFKRCAGLVTITSSCSYQEVSRQLFRWVLRRNSQEYSSDI